MKFRIVKITKDTEIIFAVEKQRRFLWWTWWDIILISEGDSWYYSDVYSVYKTLEEAEAFIREQNIQIEIVKEIII